jgi:class 3 adenylate cyclase
VRKYQEAAGEADARALLPAITVPTLVMHPTDNAFLPVEFARYVADHIEGCTFVEIPSRDVQPWWDRPEAALGAIEEFITGSPRAAPADRQLATVLFTDIVDSTIKAEQLGDRRWATVLDLHDGTAKGLVEENAGRLIKTTGDGILAAFDGPGRAIRSAAALKDELAKVGLQIRCGIHTGEVELRGDDVRGLAVHLAARIMATAEPEEILVSATVKDLVIGSEIAFQDRGAHSLKGMDGRWRLYSVMRGARG